MLLKSLQKHTLQGKGIFILTLWYTVITGLFLTNNESLVCDFAQQYIGPHSYCLATDQEGNCREGFLVIFYFFYICLIVIKHLGKEKRGTFMEEPFF